VIWTHALPEPQPDADVKAVPEASSGGDAGTDQAAAETVEAAVTSEEAIEAPSEGSAVPVGQTVAPTQPARRSSRWDRYRPRPAVTMLAFAAGIAIGAGIFVSRIEPAPAPRTLPPSPYGSLVGIPVAPFPVAVLMEGLTTSPERLPTVLPDRALSQLKRVVDSYAVVSSIEHQGTIVVGNQAVSALVIRGIDSDGRTAATVMTARLVDTQIVEFR